MSERNLKRRFEYFTSFRDSLICHYLFLNFLPASNPALPLVQTRQRMLSPALIGQDLARRCSGSLSLVGSPHMWTSGAVIGPDDAGCCWDLNYLIGWKKGEGRGRGDVWGIDFPHNVKECTVLGRFIYPLCLPLPYPHFYTCLTKQITDGTSFYTFALSHSLSLLYLTLFICSLSLSSFALSYSLFSLSFFYNSFPLSFFFYISFSLMLSFFLSSLIKNLNNETTLHQPPGHSDCIYWQHKQTNMVICRLTKKTKQENILICFWEQIKKTKLLKPCFFLIHIPLVFLWESLYM